MNRTDRTLFHRRTLDNAVGGYVFPPNLVEKHEKLQKWIAALASGTLDEVKEVSLHGEFLLDVFREILGYRSLIQGLGKTWEIHAEQSISDRGGSADGALGFFTATENQRGKVKLQGQVVAPIELKGAKTDLDRQKAGESPVDQGWRYANHTEGCKWVIVSNYREVRLYCTRKSTAYYESFFLENLASLEEFKRFYYVLCRRNFLPGKPDSALESSIDRLLKECDSREQKITDELYQRYKQTREGLVNDFLLRKDTAPNQELLLIEKAQKLLDRVLFIAFCEDQQLLPQHTLKKAHDHQNPYEPRPKWENFKAVFRWVDRGNDDPPIPGYNGGLFAYDDVLDEQLFVRDERCTQLKELTEYEFDRDVSADVLGRIFEQSITDLEELKAEKTGQAFDQKSGKRKTQGVYYTPAWVTQYIVKTAIGHYLQQQEENLGLVSEASPDRALQQWQTYRDRLHQIRVVDPACGSGAFLIAAFDYLRQEFDRVEAKLSDLGADRSQLDFDRHILTQNLFGVDLSPESVEITKLSLWLKTAVPGRPLTNLDYNIKVGNSIVQDAAIDRAFNWETEFSEVFAAGGFDVVIGNPPYVRQEFLSPIKPYLQQHYESYDGVADLYTYFYEKGLKILKSNGILSYIVTNKWLRSGYGEPLRRFFSQNSIFEQIIDFGHAPIFQDVDTFPCIVVARNSRPHPPAPSPQGEGEPNRICPPLPGGEGLGVRANPVIVCPVPREKLTDINLGQFVEEAGYSVPWSRFTQNAWSLERPEVDRLMDKIRAIGVPLKDFAGVKPFLGIKTGRKEAFQISAEIKDRLIRDDPSCSEIIKPMLRGQDIKRWASTNIEQWLILLKSSNNYTWPWSNNAETAEDIFSNTFPSLYNHLKPLENDLRKRSDKGRYWWELRSCSYYNIFNQPKIITQDLATYPWFSFNDVECLTVNTCYVWPISDLYFLGWLCSPIAWWISHQVLDHGINDTLRMFGEKVEVLPIAPPTPEIRSQAEPIVSRLIEITKANQAGYREVLDWVRSTYQIEKPGQKLEAFATLSRDEFVDELRKRLPKSKSKSDRISPAALKEIKEVYGDYALPMQARSTEAQRLEHQLSDLVNQAYCLTPEEIELMWKTAPPRMPISR